MLGSAAPRARELPVDVQSVEAVTTEERGDVDGERLAGLGARHDRHERRRPGPPAADSQQNLEMRVGLL